MSPVPGKNRSPYLWKLTVITLKNIKEKQLRNLKALHNHTTKSKMETRLKIVNQQLQQQQQQSLLVKIVRFLVKKIVRLKIVNIAIKNTR
jgi:ribosomal protein S20